MASMILTGVLNAPVCTLLLFLLAAGLTGLPHNVREMISFITSLAPPKIRVARACV
jgi:hypothetical protein